MIDKLKSIGTITFHAAHNYGSVYQAYALQQVLLHLGYKSEIINLRTNKQREVYSIITKRKGFKYLLKNAYYSLNIKNRKEKHRKFEDFINNILILSNKSYASLQELLDEPPKYDYYLSGSDQIWNTNPGDFDWSYYLPFVKEGIKMSYAPSFGPIGEFDEKTKKSIKKYIESFDYISVRENSAAQLVNELIGKEVPVLVDPTLLIDKEDWDILNKPVKTPEKYIFFYTLFANNEMIKMVKKISKNLGLPVLTPYVSNQYDILSGFGKVTDCGPEEFLSYLKGAELVISSSYHGVIFSIIYERPFYAVNGINDMRMNTLLTKTNLINRSIVLSEVDEKTNSWQEIDFTGAKKMINLEKEKSIAYLLEALEN